jgi:hypothetical protein
MTELIAYVNDEMPTGHIAYHLEMPVVRQNKDIKALKKAIKKRKKEEEKLANKGRKDGTEDIDIFG